MFLEVRIRFDGRRGFGRKGVGEGQERGETFSLKTHHHLHRLLGYKNK